MKDLSHQEVEQILRLIDQSTYDQVSIELGDLKIRISRTGKDMPQTGEPAPPASGAAKHAEETSATAAAPQPAKTATQPLEKPAAGSRSADSRLHIVTAPMVGVFYAASSPEATPFAQPGSRVSASDTVCLLEVMKLFQSVPAGIEGTIKEVLVESGTLVEFGTELFVIERASPASAS